MASFVLRLRLTAAQVLVAAVAHRQVAVAHKRLAEVLVSVLVAAAD